MASRCIALAAGLAVTALSLQGCGSSGDNNNNPPADATTTTTLPTTTTVTTTTARPVVSMFPIRAVTYEAVPTFNLSLGIPGVDYMQVGYSTQWAEDGRDDLGTVSRMGANAVRVVHGLGVETSDHGGFLDRAHALGINVIVGFHTQNICPDFDCYQAWKKAAADGFAKAGFTREGYWHPAVKMIALMDEPDALNFIGAPTCGGGSDPEKAVCRTRAVLSALEGLLDAESDAGVDGSTVNITVAWSFGASVSIDGVLPAGTIGTWGFQDVFVGTKDPSKANYTQKGKQDLKKAYDTRWVHSVNAPSTWAFIKEKVYATYAGSQFATRPWFLAGYRPGDDEADLKTVLTDMESSTSDGNFKGVTFQSFQHDYIAATPWGLYGLGTTKIGDCKPCQTDVQSQHTECPEGGFPVYCLDPNLKGSKLSAVMDAWNGKPGGKGECASQLELVV